MTKKTSKFLNSSCYCCGENSWNYTFDTDGGDYAYCKKCSHYIQINYASQGLEVKFEEEQKKNYDDDSVCLSPLFTYLQNEATEKRFEVIRKYLKVGNLIEVGPGNGDVLQKAIDLGYTVDAVEHSETLASAILKRLGIKVKVGAFEDQQFDNTSYDAYMSFHVIEHIPDVIAHLEKASSIVKKGGYAFIATPNAGGWEHQLPFNLSPNYSSAHLQLFSSDSLTLCLEKTGWKIEAFYTPEYISSWLRVATAVLRKLRGSKNAVKRGEYMKSSNSNLKPIIQFFAFLSKPLRMLQVFFKGGNELFIVAKKN